jgi:hypothetical protein
VFCPFVVENRRAPRNAQMINIRAVRNPPVAPDMFAAQFRNWQV